MGMFDWLKFWKKEPAAEAVPEVKPPDFAALLRATLVERTVVLRKAIADSESQTFQAKTRARVEEIDRIIKELDEVTR